MRSAARSQGRHVQLPPTLRNDSLESAHQQFIVKWLRNRRYLFTAPGNGHFNSRNARIKASRQGMEAGVPDLLIFEQRHGYSGLGIEMKRPKPYASVLSVAQQVYHDRLREKNWLVVTCYGAQEALDLLVFYFDAPLGLSEPVDDATQSI
jgi:hypothetical protein